jgi:hypothetical protein
MLNTIQKYKPDSIYMNQDESRYKTRKTVPIVSYHRTTAIN